MMKLLLSLNIMNMENLMEIKRIKIGFLNIKKS